MREYTSPIEHLGQRRVVGIYVPDQHSGAHWASPLAADGGEMWDSIDSEVCGESDPFLRRDLLRGKHTPHPFVLTLIHLVPRKARDEVRNSLLGR